MKDRITSAKIDPATGPRSPSRREVSRQGPVSGPQAYRRRRADPSNLLLARLARRWLDTTAAKLELGQFEDTRPLERQTVHELVDRYVREVMQTRQNDRKGHIPSILQDEIAQLALVDL